MAKSSLGRAVSRVGASGGGKTYGKTRPAFYYIVLSAIVVIGLIAVGYSRYERFQAANAASIYPVDGTTAYFGLGEEACGAALPALGSGPVPDSPYTVLEDNVIEADATSAATSGRNINIGGFLAKVPGLVMTTQEMKIPITVGSKVNFKTYKAGVACPKGTKYAGKLAYPEVAYWTSVAQPRPSISNDPSAILLSQFMLVTLSYEPKGVYPSAPTKTTIDYLESLNAQNSTTTTTVAGQTSTTLPVTTTTSAPTTTTTAH